MSERERLDKAERRSRRYRAAIEAAVAALEAHAGKPERYLGQGMEMALTHLRNALEETK